MGSRDRFPSPYGKLKSKEMKGKVITYEVPIDKLEQNVRQQKEVGSTVRNQDFSKPVKVTLTVFRPERLKILDEYVDCIPTFR